MPFSLARFKSHSRSESIGTTGEENLQQQHHQTDSSQHPNPPPSSEPRPINRASTFANGNASAAANGSTTLHPPARALTSIDLAGQYQKLRSPNTSNTPSLLEATSDPTAVTTDTTKPPPSAISSRAPSSASLYRSASATPSIAASEKSETNKWSRSRASIHKERSMAAAAVHKMMHGKEDRALEREFISHWQEGLAECDQDHINDIAREMGLGQSSKMLKKDDFEIMKTLGTGTFARVSLVRLKCTKDMTEEAKADCRARVYALKVLHKGEVVRLKQVEHVNQEREILRSVAGHPLITTLITTFADDQNLYMLLDYCPGGEIFSYLRKKKRFSEGAARFYTAEMVVILKYLHETEGVAYRDLKPENILLDEAGHIKLVDFGFAKKIQDRETYTLCGTPEYLAPEVIQSIGHTTAVDWWALGILLYEFVTGYPPFWSTNPMDIYKQILHKSIDFEPGANGKNSKPLKISDDCKDLITQLCQVDRAKRLGNIEGGASRVQAHPFFNNVDWGEVFHRRGQWERGPIIPPVRWVGDTSCFDTYDDEDTSKLGKWGREEQKKSRLSFRNLREKWRNHERMESYFSEF